MNPRKLPSSEGPFTLLFPYPGGFRPKSHKFPPHSHFCSLPPSSLVTFGKPAIISLLEFPPFLAPKVLGASGASGRFQSRAIFGRPSGRSWKTRNGALDLDPRLHPITIQTPPHNGNYPNNSRCLGQGGKLGYSSGAPVSCSSIGSFHGPLLVLDGLEDSGIRLKCLSERLFSEVQVLWMDGKGRNITGNPLSTDTTGNAGSSIVLTPGSGNAVSCRIIDSLGKTSTESSIVIAESFFPAISPWLPAFVMILLFGIFLVLAAVYKLRINKKAMDREKNAQKQIQEDIEDLKMELEEVQEKFQKENQEMESKIEQIQAQLEFRRAQSNAVPLTLDVLCKHPELSLRDQSRVVSCSATSEQLHPKPVIVSKESFSQGKHYWEVEVGAGSGWELGVLAEEIRDSLQNGGMVLPQEREQVLSLGYSGGEFSIPRGWNCRPCPVLGVFLDQESHSLSFFDVEGKSLLTSLPLRFSGNLFPFFSPGSNEKGLGIRSVGG